MSTTGDRGQSPGCACILEANQAAADFFAGQLLAPDAVAGRQFLHERGFTREHADHFGIGFAPRGGKELRDHLLGKGFSRDDLVKAGLVRESGWDFFQARLVWPIRTRAARRSVSGRGGSSTTTACRPSTINTPRDDGLQEEPCALRARPGPAQHR